MAVGRPCLDADGRIPAGGVAGKFEFAVAPGIVVFDAQRVICAAESGNPGRWLDLDCPAIRNSGQTKCKANRNSIVSYLLRSISFLHQCVFFVPVVIIAGGCRNWGDILFPGNNGFWGAWSYQAQGIVERNLKAYNILISFRIFR